ncbi:riboflavin biosynthesis protein RibD [Leptothrix cholodnii SP-6]|uniref:Riboflavin biosynthesis protein RibD n=1 Tax=Leptothrix cholodnii (strain ATCC 51168 / LMG 8142 / SP-6) TaxID=395495 RepID=B1XYF4_LEPCP|nr:riboflavin biosynthesis protein RibD [Leptothrix cholodnii SP-6]
MPAMPENHPHADAPAPSPAPFSPQDQQAMAQALALAEQGFGLTEPNPRVGCVIVDAQGRLLGSGHTQQAGGPHAEVMAMRTARAAGHSLIGATAYVTLEPCAHHGRTPPCADALIEAGLKRVVAAITDPFPLVAGQGLARLAAAGIQVEQGLMAEAATAINIGFFSRVLRQRPWVRMKVAASLDGRTALMNGQSQWITGAAARADGHAWRRRASAVLTGIGTVLDDDPRLDVRHVPTPRQPMRVVVDAPLRTPVTARLLAPPGEVLVYTSADETAQAAWLAEVQAAHGARAALGPDGTDVAPPLVQCVSMPGGPAGKVDLAAMLADLARRGVNELHVEAGHRLNGSLLREGLVDEFLVYLAPKLLGLGREMWSWGPLESLDQAIELEWGDVQSVGGDLRLLARPRGRLAGWLPGTP